MADLRDFKQLELSLVADLDKLRELAQEHLGENEEIAAALTRLHSGRFTLAVVGEFKRGKSTLINALLGQDILPTDVLPTTATLNRLVYGLEKSVDIHYKDGSEERIPLEQLSAYVTKLNDESTARAQSIREAVVHFPCQYCRNGVELVDTPGLQDEAAMTEVTMQVLPQVDAAVLVISALSPLSESEMNFLEQLGYGQAAKVFIVVSSIDRLTDPSQVDRLIAGLQRRLDKMDDSIRENLHPRLFPVSAFQALQGRMNNDGDLLRASRLDEFEAALARFLGEERGAAALLVPVQIGLAVAAQIKKELERKVEDWRQRDAALQRRKQELDSRPQGVVPRSFEPLAIQQFLSAEPSWKNHVRTRLNELIQDLPNWAQSQPAPSLFAAFKASLETREQLPRHLFAGLQQALQQGLEQYEQELLKLLDRTWDDFVDAFPIGNPADGLQRNAQWCGQWAQRLRERLALQYAGGFMLQKSWASRPDLWVLRNPPAADIRRELETELVRQLGGDLSAMLREWYDEAALAYKQAVSQLPAPKEQNDGLRTWVRDSVLMEKEQADLRGHWARLEAIHGRLHGLRAQLQDLVAPATPG
jgi:predicted GTPase